MTTVSIPSSLKGVTDKLGSLGELIRVREWEKAALIAAFVRLETHDGRPARSASTSRFLSTRGFAELGIIGLRSKDTVRLYVMRWLEAHDGIYPEPGAKVTLPDIDWPPTRTGTDGYESDEGAEHTIDRLIERHGPAIIATAVSKPEVAEAVLDNQQAYQNIIKAQGKRAASAPQPRPSPGGGLVGEVEKAQIRIASMAVAQDAAELHKVLTKHIKDATPWRPKEEQQVTADIDKALTLLGDCKAMLTPITDEGLAEFLGR